MLGLTAVAFAPPLFLPIPLAEWQLGWLPFDGCGEARQSAFRSIYKLAIVPIAIDPEAPPVDCIVPTDTALWLSWFVFLATPAAACTGGCQQSKLPWQTTPP